MFLSGCAGNSARFHPAPVKPSGPISLPWIRGGQTYERLTTRIPEDETSYLPILLSGPDFHEVRGIAPDYRSASSWKGFLIRVKPVTVSAKEIDLIFDMYRRSCYLKETRASEANILLQKLRDAEKKNPAHSFFVILSQQHPDMQNPDLKNLGVQHPQLQHPVEKTNLDVERVDIENWTISIMQKGRAVPFKIFSEPSSYVQQVDLPKFSLGPKLGHNFDGSYARPGYDWHWFRSVSNQYEISVEKKDLSLEQPYTFLFVPKFKLPDGSRPKSVRLEWTSPH